jgi:hypothetical protein
MPRPLTADAAGLSMDWTAPHGQTGLKSREYRLAHNRATAVFLCLVAAYSGRDLEGSRKARRVPVLGISTRLVPPIPFEMGPRIPRHYYWSPVPCCTLN